MIKTVGKPFGRALHFDFHTSPGVENIMARFDAEHFAAQLAEAKVEYINMAARCNMGYSYYNTKVGKKYPGLGERDLLGEIIEACHKRGIGVTAYFNVGLDHDFAADHTDWLKVDRNGAIYKEDKKNNFFRTMCYNSGYRAHFLAEIREVCENYEIDGLFCDCFKLEECYCPTCMADMARRGVNSKDTEAVLDYQNDIRLEFAREIYAAAGEKAGKIKFYFNSLTRAEELGTHAEIECLTTDSHWGYDTLDSMAAYMRTQYEDRVYMSGRFQNSWGDFGGIKTLTSMQNDLYDSMMNSLAISYGDHLHPVDGMEDEVVSRIGQVMRERMAYEPYIEGSDNRVEIGVIRKKDPRTNRFPHSGKGATRLLKELKLLYNVYDEYGPFDRDGLKLLILGEQGDWNASFKERLCAYAAAGGKLLFIGEAIELGKELGLLDYLEVVGADPRDNAYYTVEGSSMRWAMYNPAMILKNKSGKEMARYVGNIMNFTWDGRQSCYYRPQGDATEFSAAVLGTASGCICFDLLTAYSENFLTEHRELFDRMVKGLLSERYVEAPQMPKTATVALTQTEKCTVFHVKSTFPEFKMKRGIVEEHIYMKSVPVSVKGAYRVYALPEKLEVESRIQNGRTCFETGDVLGYKAFLLEE